MSHVLHYYFVWLIFLSVGHCLVFIVVVWLKITFITTLWNKKKRWCDASLLEGRLAN